MASVVMVTAAERNTSDEGSTRVPPGGVRRGRDLNLRQLLKDIEVWDEARYPPDNTIQHCVKRPPTQHGAGGLGRRRTL